MTPPGRGALAVVRCSGSKVKAFIQTIANSKASYILSHPREMVRTEICRINSKNSNVYIDDGLVCYFNGPHSFTGEDVVEFFLHGSPLLVDLLIESGQNFGLRMARPGEFSERGYHNGQMDLTQVEGIADVISAESTAQLQVAQKQLKGWLSSALAELGNPLRDLLAEVEAYIDFPEEGIEFPTGSSWENAIAALVDELKRYSDSYKIGRIYREGAKVVLLGLPNAGKSSLLNSLIGEERVIVSPIAGTTRDSIEVRIDLNGILISLWDTAGVTKDTRNGSDAATDSTGVSEREFAQNSIEQIGKELSWKRAGEADAIVFVYDPLQPHEQQDDLLKQIQTSAASAQQSPIITVRNKCDLSESEAIETNTDAIAVSTITKQGLPELKTAILKELVGSTLDSNATLICNRRHQDNLLTAQRALTRAIENLKNNQPIEFIAADLREALGALQEIIGITTPDNILGLIFAKFCIGK